MQTPNMGMQRLRLLLPRATYEDIVAQARAELPAECCGLLAGRIATAHTAEGVRIERRYPLVNALSSPTEYLSDGRSILDAFRDMDARGLDLLAVYHSHPTSRPVPSKKDLAENGYGDDIVHFILSLAEEPPLLRGWRLGADAYEEASWEVT
jgi:[CysO sulfur-carrier protein]-S-L-cysteine hydrolase